MTVEELREELSFWKKRANALAQSAKFTMKRAFKVQKVSAGNSATNCRLTKGVDLRCRHDATGSTPAGHIMRTSNASAHIPSSRAGERMCDAQISL